MREACVKTPNNKALLRAAQELVPEQMSIEIFDLSAIPLYNADVEAGSDPAPVFEFKQAIKAADGLRVTLRRRI